MSYSTSLPIGTAFWEREEKLSKAWTLDSLSNAGAAKSKRTQKNFQNIVQRIILKLLTFKENQYQPHLKEEIERGVVYQDPSLQWEKSIITRINPVKGCSKLFQTLGSLQEIYALIPLGYLLFFQYKLSWVRTVFIPKKTAADPVDFIQRKGQEKEILSHLSECDALFSSHF